MSMNKEFLASAYDYVIEDAGLPKLTQPVCDVNGTMREQFTKDQGREFTEYAKKAKLFSRNNGYMSDVVEEYAEFYDNGVRMGPYYSSKMMWLMACVAAGSSVSVEKISGEGYVSAREVRLLWPSSSKNHVATSLIALANRGLVDRANSTIQSFYGIDFDSGTKEPVLKQAPVYSLAQPRGGKKVPEKRTISEVIDDLSVIVFPSPLKPVQEK